MHKSTKLNHLLTSVQYDVKNDLRKMKITKWSELAHDRLEWKKTVEKAKTLHEF